MSRVHHDVVSDMMGRVYGQDLDTTTRLVVYIMIRRVYVQHNCEARPYQCSSQPPIRPTCLARYTSLRMNAIRYGWASHLLSHHLRLLHLRLLHHLPCPSPSEVIHVP